MNHKELANPPGLLALHQIIALEQYTNESPLIHQVKTLANHSKPDLFSVFCMPGQLTWTENGLTRPIANIETNCRMYDEKIDALKWIVQAYPQSSFTVYLCDDDMAYCFNANYDPNLVEQHKQKLQEQLSTQLGKSVAVITITSAAKHSGINYSEMQKDIQGQIYLAETDFIAHQKLSTQFKAVSAEAKRVINKLIQQGVPLTDTDKKNILLSQAIGPAIQGEIANRIHGQSSDGAVYLGTIPDHSSFITFDIPVILANSAIPAIYCPAGELDFDSLYTIRDNLTNPSRNSAPIARSAGYKPVACDDMVWTK